MSALGSRYAIDTTSLFFHPKTGTDMNTLQPQPAESAFSLAGLSAGMESRPLLDRATQRASELAQGGADAVRDTTQYVRDAAWRASDNTVRLVRNEPVKSILLAAAAGAALMALVGLLVRLRAPPTRVR